MRHDSRQGWSKPRALELPAWSLCFTNPIRATSRLPRVVRQWACFYIHRLPGWTATKNVLRTECWVAMSVPFTTSCMVGVPITVRAATDESISSMSIQSLARPLHIALSGLRRGAVFSHLVTAWAVSLAAQGFYISMTSFAGKPCLIH